MSLISKAAQTYLDDVERMYTLLKRLKVDHNLLSVQVARAPANYFDLSLQDRATFLKAPSTFHLCKTIIMQNTKHDAGLEAFPQAAADPHYHKYVCVITQFEGKLNSQKILNIMKALQHEKSSVGVKMSLKGFHFRLAEETEALELSGYQYNAITPFFMKNPTIPIILSQDIAELDPAYLWFSGGRINVKMGVSVADFLRFFGPDRVIVSKI